MLCAFILVTAAGCASSEKQRISDRQGEIFLNSGTEALMEGRSTDALGFLQQAVRLLPKNPSAWSNLGLAYTSRGDLEKAEDAFKQSLKLNPQFNDARMNLASVYMQSRRYPEAEKLYKEVLKDLAYSNSHQAHYNLALLYSQQNRQMLAEQQFNLAVRINDRYCPAWFKLGMLQKEKGDFIAAANSLKKSVSGPCFRNPEAHFEIGALYLKNKETDQAKKKLVEVIQLFPESEWARKAELTLNMLRE